MNKNKYFTLHERWRSIGDIEEGIIEQMTEYGSVDAVSIKKYEERRSKDEGRKRKDRIPNRGGMRKNEKAESRRRKEKKRKKNIRRR